MTFGHKESYEASYHAGKLPDDDKRSELSDADTALLKVIAQRVGGDFGMTVRIGKTGEGSFFNPEDASITFDPLHIKENPSLARFVAGHEGAHRAITPGPQKIGLSQEDTERLYSQLGFGYLQNIIEDPAVNDWLAGRFPGLAGDMEGVYNGQFEKENAAFLTPEIQKIMQRLGHVPRFVQFGSEIMRDWFQGRFSTTLDPDVYEALKKTIDAARKSRTTIPDPLRRSKAQIIGTAQTRFKINTSEIWPEMKKLIEQDLHIEEIRQMLNNLRKKQEEIKEKQKELESAEEKGDREGAESLKREIEELKKETRPLDEMDKDAREEINKKIEEAIEELEKDLQEDRKKKEDAIQEKQSDIDKKNKELQELEKQLDSGDEMDADSKESIKKQIEQKKEEIQKQEEIKKNLERELEDIKHSEEKGEEGEGQQPGGELGGEDDSESIGDPVSGGGSGRGRTSNKKSTEQQPGGERGVGEPLPYDELSQKTKEELEKALEKTPQEKREEYQKKGKEELEDLEDKINEELSSKLNPNKQPKHHEDSMPTSRSSPELQEDESDVSKRLLKELERVRKEKMTPYERAREEVVGLIDDLYRRLRKILKPEEEGEEESGYASGSQPDFSRIMSAERDISQRQKIWMRENEPTKKDFRFWHLLDVSGSMEGERIQEALKGFIVAGEAIDRLENLNAGESKIRQGITAFHKRVFPIKKPNERFTKEVTDVLSTMPNRVHDDDAGTNTFKGTRESYDEMKKDLGESGNYILTFSDGRPESDVEKLKQMLKETKEERKKLKIKIGLIWIGDPMSERAIADFKREFEYDFILSMPAVQPPEEDGKQKTDFSENFADLLEDIVKYPEKY